LSRHCPWCHARKVSTLYENLRRGPLSNPKGKLLFYGKASPVEEPKYLEHAFYTREHLTQGLLEDSYWLGIDNGVWVHQLGPGLRQNGLPTFIHDVALIGEVDDAAIDRMERDADGTVFGGGIRTALSGDLETSFNVFWTLLPANHPAALRIALAGSTGSYPVEKLGLPPEWFRNHHDHRTGMRGALGWQPTFLLDPQTWSLCAGLLKCQRMYQAFGTWRQSLGRASREARESISEKFARVQAAGRVRDRQQKGNRRRCREAEDRRQGLLEVARPLWSQVQVETKGGKGRPAYRSALEAMLGERGITVSRRDMDWVMKGIQTEFGTNDGHSNGSD
jgi:hypothetical protein